MKSLAILFMILAIALGSFGYWGSYTKAGQQQYDEMAGMIPEFATFVSILLFILSITFFIVLFVRARKQSSH